MSFIEVTRRPAVPSSVSCSILAESSRVLRGLADTREAGATSCQGPRPGRGPRTGAHDQHVRAAQGGRDHKHCLG